MSFTEAMKEYIMLDWNKLKNLDDGTIDGAHNFSTSAAVDVPQSIVIGSIMIWA